jgi:hypothetical protein
MSARSDLRAQMEAAAAAVRQQHLQHARALGVSFATIAEMGLVAPPFGIACARITDEGMLEFGEGPAHFVQPVLADGAILDLVGWRSLQPSRWGLCRGSAWALGADNIARSRDLGVPLKLEATPLDYLRGAAKGLAIIDWDAPEVRQLIEVDAIEVDDKRLGDLLLNQISKPIRLPRIIERREMRHGA